MPWLTWINDEDLKSEVSSLLAIASNAKKVASSDFGKNIIDPFAAMKPYWQFSPKYFRKIKK